MRWMLGVTVVALVGGCPPSIDDLERRLAAERPHFEHLVSLVQQHHLTLVSDSQFEPRVGAEVEAEVRSEMKTLGVEHLVASDGVIKLDVYARGLSVSGVFRGYLFDPDAKVAGARRVDGSWAIYAR